MGLSCIGTAAEPKSFTSLVAGHAIQYTVQFVYPL
jgi:hypothetical protein